MYKHQIKINTESGYKQNLSSATADITQMNDELEYIVSSYASLKLNSHPLKDVSVNSPAKLKPISPHKRSTIITNSPHEVRDICINSIDLVLRNLKYVKSMNSSFLRLASSAFIQLYKIDIQEKKKEVFKKHQTYILKLIELETSLQSDYSYVLNEIRVTASEGSSEHRSNAAENILFGPSSISLKFLVLQIIFKKFKAGHFEDTELILSFFHHDKSMLPDLTHAQKISLTKLTLSFIKFSRNASFKLCLNLKFLQYLKVFELQFQEFITNSTIGKLSDELSKEIQQIKELGQSPAFLYSYLLFDHNEVFDTSATYLKSLQSQNIYTELNWSLILPDQSRCNNLLKLLSLHNVNSELINSELQNLGRPTTALYLGLRSYIEKSLQNPQKDIIGTFIWFLDHTDKIDRQTTKLSDRFLMVSQKLINFSPLLHTAFLKLMELFGKNNQFKRLRNISNLLYNIGLKLEAHSDLSEFMTSCVKCELLLFKNSKKLTDLAIKLEKVLKLFLFKKIPTDFIFTLVWNDEFLDDLQPKELLHKLDVMDTHFGNTFSFYQPSNSIISHLSEQNKALAFVLIAKYSSSLNLRDLFYELRLNDQSLQMLCGSYYTEIPFVKHHASLGQPVIHASSLIKSAYYLALEIKAKSTTNIMKILHLYLLSWVPKNRDSLTLFELHFLETFVDYLKFINFHNALHELLLGVDKYLSQEISGFKEWYALEKVNHHLSVKDIGLIDASVFDFNSSSHDFMSATDLSICQLELLVLKAKFCLNVGEENKLLSLAREVQEFLSENSMLTNFTSNSPLTKKQLLRVIKSISKLHLESAKLFKLFGNHMEAFISAKTCAQVTKSALKTGAENFEIITSLSTSFKFLLSTLIHLGSSKDADYYMGEFAKFNDSIMKFKTLFTQNCYFICYYYYTAGRIDELRKSRQMADKIFKTLNINEKEPTDNYKLVFYHHLAQVYDVCDESRTDLKQQLKNFFNHIDKDKKCLSNSWKLKYEYHFNSEYVDLTLNKTSDPYLHAMNYMINSKRLFNSSKRSLEVDPVFSTLEDSAMSIPSTRNNHGYSKEASNSIRPKSKTMRNMNKAIIDLRHSKDMVLSLFPELPYLANYQIDNLHKTFALALLTLSSISNGYNNESLDDLYNLGEHLKNNPFVNDKNLIEATSRVPNLTPNFNIHDPSSLKQALLSQSEIDQSLLKKIPDDWLVISVDICSFNGDLIISRLTREKTVPSVLRLPLSRHSSRTVDEESFSFVDAMRDLTQIIQESNATTSKERTSSIKSAEDRQKWHEERFALDEKLAAFLNKIEYCWIGGFKGIFDCTKIDQTRRDQFKEKFLAILSQNIPSRSQRNPNATIIELDDFIIDLFLGLGDPSELMSTELLEDLIYFVLDVLLFHGEENAYDEIDIDNIYVEVETLIKEDLMLYSSGSRYKHTVLITGKDSQSIPWESLPSLRGISTSRMPSLNMLLKLLEKNERMVVNKRNGSYILNPSGDLKRTEERFEKQSKHLIETLNWNGIQGERPTEAKFEEFVRDSNIFIYIGHGGGEQFIRTTTLKKLNQAAPTLLLGCSSALLKDNNLLEPCGTIYSYLVGGCPMILGNLWDVTDKDIDKFSMSLFENWGLSAGSEGSGMTISEAVKHSRDECKLKYLNGAAPVVYGLPLSLL